jgi:hypothetical protein
MPEAPVATKSPFYQRMAPRWALVKALLGGTEAMRAGREKWLPKHEEETHKGYERRLKQGFLFEALADAIERVVAKPFSKDVVVKGALPEGVDPIIDNADQRGRNLTQFAREVFEDGVSYGLSHILVDFPQGVGGLNLGQQRRLNLHPYLTHVEHDDLWGARWEELPTGQTRLKQIRVHECHIEDDGDFGEKEVDFVRVINAPPLSEDGTTIVGKGTWSLWKRSGKGNAENDWSEEDSGEHSYPGIPFVTFYAKRTDFLEAEVPFRKLAWLNLAHWQSSTDQRNILAVARVGILFAAGFTAKELEAGITIGPNNYIFSTNPEAHMAYVEHSGAAIGAGRTDLEDLKADMASLSLQPLLQQAGSQTATGKAIDESKGESVAQSWVRSLENAILDALRMAATWIGTELLADVAVDVHSDFGLSQRAIEDLRAIDKAYERGTISAKTYLQELQRRGVLREDLDLDQEIEDARNEPPRVPFVGEPEEDDVITDPEEEEGDEG